MRTLAKVALIMTWTASIHSTSAQEVLRVRRVVGVEYPWLANLAHVQGKVKLEALVLADGAVQQVRSKSGPDLLVGPAKLALGRWLFAGCTPALAPCTVEVAFVFLLEGKCEKSHCASEFVVDLPNMVTISTKAAPPIVD